MPGRAGLLYSGSSSSLLYTIRSQMKSGINEKKKKYEKKSKNVRRFAVFSAPLELNYVGTVICSLSAGRWQTPVAQFEGCVVKCYWFAPDLEIPTAWHAPCER